MTSKQFEGEQLRMKVWFTSAFGQIEGPFALSQIEDKIQKGQIQSSDLIYRSGEKKWQPVKNWKIFQNSILKSKTTSRSVPKKDWIVATLMQPSQGSLCSNRANQTPVNFEYKAYSQKEIKASLHQGVIGYSDWVWTEGMKDWKPIRDLPLFQGRRRKKKVLKKSAPDLGQVTDLELLQSVVKAKPSSYLIDALIGKEKKPDEAQGPDLARQFGNFKFDESSTCISDTSFDKKSVYKKTSHEGISLKKIAKNRGPTQNTYALEQDSLKPKGFYQKSANYFWRGSLAILGFVTMTLVFVNAFYVKRGYEPLQKETWPLRYDVLNNGRELQFWVKEYFNEKMYLTFTNVKGQTLNANDFRRKVQVQLDKNGKAVLRLDHWGLAEGYYRFTGNMGGDRPFDYQFFVGGDRTLFAEQLIAFKQQRELEKMKIEDIKNKKSLRSAAQHKKQLPDGMKNFYGLVRNLEKGYGQYRQDVRQWKSFYHSWENSFHQFQVNAVSSAEEHLDLTLMRELKTIQKELKLMGEKMDQFVANDANENDVMLLSPQVAVFLEKVKNHRKF